MPRVEVKRRLEQRDLDALSRLLAKTEGSDGKGVLWERPSGPQCGPFAGVMAWERGHDDPVGYAQLTREGGSWDLELVFDPEHSRSSGAVAEELALAALDVVGRAGGGRVHLWAPDSSAVHRQAAKTAGLNGQQSLYQMRRGLPIEDPGTLLTRPFRMGADEEEWLEVNRRAFRGQPEQSGWTRHELDCRLVEPWFDPEGFLLHERDGRLAGFCWTKVHRQSQPRLGEIYVLGVDPDFQGLGLGRQLLLAGLHHLSGKQLDTAMLYVDAANSRATSLYRTLGFTVHHEDRAYVSDVAPAKDPST